MPSEIDLVNDALGQIGASPITSLGDGSVAANHALRFYPTLRDAAIRAHHWNFAMGRATLAASATAPPFEFTFAYPLPSDLLKIVQYNGKTNATEYRIEGRSLLTDDATAQIVYLKRIENPDLFDALFYQFLTTWLASKFALAISKDKNDATLLLKQAFQILLPTAEAVDGQEGSLEAFTVDDLIAGR